MGATGRAAVAAAAALALADASIVALALPPLLVELHTTISGVAAIVGVYALVLAVGLVVAERLPPRPGVVAGALVVFAAGSALCAVAGSLGALLAFRAVQGAGAAVALPGAFVALDAGASAAGRRLWLGAALAGTAAGPALGGALTQAFDWRAIFAIQAPIALVAALAAARVPAARPASAPPTDAPRAGSPPAPPPPSPAAVPFAPGRTRAVLMAALVLVAAAFTAVLFLLVLQLVAGFAYSPLKAAAAVLVLPAAALVAGGLTRPTHPALPRAAAGAMLVTGGAAALAFLPTAGIGWTVPPQVLAGAGMGLAVPAFAGGLLPERTPRDAARLLAARSAGTVLVLAILAPVATHALDTATDRAVLQGTALVLDARLPPLQKLDLAPALLDGVQTERPRAGLKAAVNRRRGEFADQAVAYRQLAQRLDGVVVRAVQDAFRAAYLIAGALGLLGAALLVPRAVRAAVGVAAAAAVLVVAVYAVEHDRRAPPEVVLRDPCKPRPLPDSGGLSGALQNQALKLLDRAACHAGSSREELVLALADRDRAQAYQRRYGVDPRSIGGLFNLLGG